MAQSGAHPLSTLLFAGEPGPQTTIGAVIAFRLIQAIPQWKLLVVEGLMRIKNKLLLAILGIGVLPLICATGVISYSISDQVGDALFKQAGEKLLAVREARREQIGNYFKQLQTVVISIADSADTAAAMRDLANGFENDATPDDTEQASIRSYYQQDFLTHYRQQDHDIAPQTINAYLDKADKATLFYQARYISANPNPVGSKQLLDQAISKGKFASRYDRYHATYHPVFRKMLGEFGFYDLFLINNDGRVVYTVFKEADYAASLTSSALADSGLAKAWQAALKADKGQSVLTDFSAYFPSYGAPAAFMSTPVFEGNNRIGTLVVQVSQEQLNNLMTSNHQWANIGLGSTGESFLVGADSLSRSESRLLLHDPDGFLKQVSATGEQSDKALQAMRVRRAASGYLKISHELVQKALGGESGVVRTADYAGRAAIIAYAPLTVQGQQWVVLAQMERSEALAGVSTILASISRMSMLILVVVVGVAVLVGLTTAQKLVSPLRELVSSFQELARGQGNLRVQLASAQRQDEIGELSVAFNAFIGNIRDIVLEVSSSAGQLKDVALTLHAQMARTLEGMSEQRAKSQTIASAMTEFAASIEDVARSSQDTFDAMSQADAVTVSGANNAQRSASEIDKLAQGTRTSAESMSYLSQQIDDISSVLEVINGIASQTSLLALNAAIEAARAGEMGRGFAVVADEVRSLSSRTQSATVDIQQRIEQLRQAADQSVAQGNLARANAENSISLVHQTASEINQIRQLVSDVQDRHAQITSALGQQQSTVKEMEHNAAEIHTLSQTGEQDTSQAAREAEHLQALSARLSELVARFNT